MYIKSVAKHNIILDLYLNRLDDTEKDKSHVNKQVSCFTLNDIYVNIRMGIPVDKSMLNLLISRILDIHKIFCTHTHTSRCRQ